MCTYKRTAKIENQLQLGIVHNEKGNMATSNERDRKEEPREETEDEDHIDEGENPMVPRRVPEGLNIQATCLRARAAR
jgi:hypothetical protein